jgi:uncharacterized Zn-binding protein involved in type VI secretion
MVELNILKDKDTTTVGNSCGLPHIAGAGTWEINSTQTLVEIDGDNIIIDGDTAIAGDGCTLTTLISSQSFVEINGILLATDSDKCENACHPDDTTASQSFVVIV